MHWAAWETLKDFDDWSDKYLAALAGLRPSGGTSVRSVMLQAETELRNRPEQLRHLIVLHDGCPCEMPSEMAPVIARIRRFAEVFSIFTTSENTSQQQIASAHKKLEDYFGAKHFQVCSMRDAVKSWCVYVKQRQRVRASRS